MTICNETGLACGCQPDEGVPCLALNGGLKRLMLEWRAEAMRLQTVITAASGASPEPTAEQILKVARGFMEPLRYKLFCEGVAALASGAPTPEPVALRESLKEMLAVREMWLGTDPIDADAHMQMMIRDEACVKSARAALATQVGAPGPGSVDPVDASITPTGAANGASQWTAVSERLPDDSRMVLVATENRKVTSAEYWAAAPSDFCPGGWCIGAGDAFDTSEDDGGITHWMELPLPPMAAADRQEPGTHS